MGKTEIIEIQRESNTLPQHLQGRLPNQAEDSVLSHQNGRHPLSSPKMSASQFGMRFEFRRKTAE